MSQFEPQSAGLGLNGKLGSVYGGMYNKKLSEKRFQFLGELSLQNHLKKMNGHTCIA